MNEKQKRFAEYYAANPNAAKAAELAGYSPKTARSIGQKLLTKDDIQKYIQELNGEGDEERIMTLSQVKAFWSEIVNDPHEKISVRLKASELLAKAEGAFFNAVRDGKVISVRDGEEKGDGMDDVVIYIPKMMTEEECQYRGD